MAGEQARNSSTSRLRAPQQNLSLTGRALRLLLAGLAVILSNFGAFAATPLSVETEREQATEQLKIANQAVAKARTAANHAKQELEAFVAQHFDQHRAAADAYAPPPPAPTTTIPKAVASGARERLETQLQELSARRDQLLENYTDSHPEVVFVKRRIAEVTRRLAAITPTPSPNDTMPAEGPSLQLGSTQQGLSGNERREHLQAVAEYDRLFDRWQLADRQLVQAMQSESLAAERVAALKTEALEAAIPNVLTASQDEPQQSHPLALAALILALVLACLAAVRLARSSSLDATFSGVDEVAAALALPVVGVVSSTRRRWSDIAPTQRRGSWPVLLLQIVMAVLLFGLIAYFVQSSEAIGRLLGQ